MTETHDIPGSVTRFDADDNEREIDVVVRVDVTRCRGAAVEHFGTPCNLPDEVDAEIVEVEADEPVELTDAEQDRFIERALNR